MKPFIRLLFFTLFLLAISSCSDSSLPLSTPTLIPSRYSRISDSAEKIEPASDHLPPVLHSPDWEEPVPMPGPINTAGGEDRLSSQPMGKRFIFSRDFSEYTILDISLYRIPVCCISRLADLLQSPLLRHLHPRVQDR